MHNFKKDLSTGGENNGLSNSSTLSSVNTRKLKVHPYLRKRT